MRGRRRVDDPSGLLFGGLALLRPGLLHLAWMVALIWLYLMLNRTERRLLLSLVRLHLLLTLVELPRLLTLTD